MKTLKRAAALLLAIMLIAAVPAMAATITVTSPIDGATYDAYKIFDVETASTTGDSYVYSIDKDSVWLTLVQKYISENTDCGITLTADADITKYYVTFGSGYDESTAKAFADYLRVNIPTSATANETVVAGSDTVTTNDDGDKVITLSPSANGYYLVMSSYGATAALVTAADTASVQEKNELPYIKKEVVTGADTTGTTTSANVGETLTFYITINVDPTSNSNYIIHDTMSAGLTLDATSDDKSSIKVTLGSKSEGSENYVYNAIDSNNYSITIPGTEESNPCAFEITIDKEYINGLEVAQPIRIEYTATVNKSAVETSASAGKEETNNVVLKVDNTTKTTTDVTVYTYGFDIVKDDSNAVILNGAKFELYDVETGGDKIDLVAVKDTDDTTILYYRPATAEEKSVTGFTSAVIEAGTAKIVGLKAGTYYLDETEAPSGYTELTEREEVKVGEDGKNSWATLNDDKDYYVSGGVAVINKRGSTVPTTGGMGTAIFYVLGSILLIGAGVILVARKRMESK